MVVRLDARARELPRTHHDLRAAMRSARADALERLGLRVELSYTGETMLPVALVAVIDELVREALDNTSRHAGVNVASVDVNAGSEEVWLRVRDHGRGYASSHNGSGQGTDTHLGRAIERARSLGARVVVASAPGQGTMVRLRASMTLP